MGLKDKARQNPSMSAVQNGICAMCCGLIWAILFGALGFGSNDWECWGMKSEVLNGTNPEQYVQTMWAVSDKNGPNQVFLASSPDCWYFTKTGMQCIISPVNTTGGTANSEAMLEAAGLVNVSSQWNALCAFGVAVYVLQFLFGCFSVAAGRSGKRNILICSNVLNACLTCLWIILCLTMAAIMFNFPSANCVGSLEPVAAQNNAPPLQPAQGGFLYVITIIYLCALPYVICAIICCVCVLLAVMAMPRD